MDEQAVFTLKHGPLSPNRYDTRPAAAPPSEPPPAPGPGAHPRSGNRNGSERNPWGNAVGTGSTRLSARRTRPRLRPGAVRRLWAFEEPRGPAERGLGETPGRREGAALQFSPPFWIKPWLEETGLEGIDGILGLSPPDESKNGPSYMKALYRQGVI